MSWEAEAWRARVDQDVTDFARDRVNILLAQRSRDGIRLALPVEVTLGEATDPMVVPAEQDKAFLTLPTETAEALFNALAAYFVGTSDVVRLNRDLAAANRRVDTLLESLARITGKGAPA